jgi:hypothetical protein
MAIIRVKKIPEFYFGDDVVLLAADREGTDAFERALVQTAKKENVPSHLIFEGTNHEFDVSGPEARVELQEKCVIWHLPDQKVSEILDKLASLKIAPYPSHYYVDIDSPARTLILSVDEYLDSPIFASPGL